MSARRRARAALAASPTAQRAERRREALDRLELWTVAAVAMARLGEPAADVWYRCACLVAAEAGFGDPPPLGELVRRYMAGPWSVGAWWEPVRT